MGGGKKNVSFIINCVFGLIFDPIQLEIVSKTVLGADRKLRFSMCERC